MLNSKKILFLIFGLLSIFPIVSLIHPGLPITHDGQDHVARIANFYLNLTEGNLIPRWAPNLNWGYGHPILEFLYPFPSYLASFFHFLSFSLVDSVKIVLALSVILSLLFMYLWLSQFTDKPSAILGATLYTYAPYRFVELYVRGDIGENLAFAFVPLVLFFVYNLYKKYNFKYVVLGSLSLGILILSHNAISLMFMPFIAFYFFLLLYLSKDRKKFFTSGFSLLILGFGISAFFWIPALIEGKYTLRNIVTQGAYINRFVEIKDLIYGHWNYGQTGQFTVQVGIFQWIFILLSGLCAYLYRKQKEYFYLTISVISLTLLAIFLMLPISNFIWDKVILLQNFQFPWRFLALTVFTGSVLAALLINVLPKKFNRNLVVFACLLIVIILSINYSKPRAYLQKPESFYKGIYFSTTDTGESAPIWSVRFMEHTPKAPIEIIEGDGEVKEIFHKSTYRKYEFKSGERARVLTNILYFPEWSIYIDGEKRTIQFQDPNYRGLMTFELDPGRHIIEAKFENTNLRKFAEIASFVSILILAIAYIATLAKGSRIRI